MADSSLPRLSPTSVGAEFQPTGWTRLGVVINDADPERQREALEQLCRDYWKPIYAFIRRHGHAQHDALDLTQSFFGHLLDRERLKLVRKGRGRFRSFLLISLKRFIKDEWQKKIAQKRNLLVTRSLDEPPAEGTVPWEPSSDDLLPDQEFDRKWALTLLVRVRERLQRKLQEGNNPALLRLLPVAVFEDRDTPYAALGAELGKSEDAIKKAIERLRGDWQELLREEVRGLVLTEEDVEDEIREVLQIVKR